MDCSHFTIATTGRTVLFPSETLLRRALRRIAALLDGRLVLFCFVDDHAHLVVVHPRGLARRVGRQIHLSLRALTSAALGPVHITPVESRRHLERLVPYLLRQPEHHGLVEHPASFGGSCFADLVGARLLVRLQLHAWLPRFERASVLDAVGLGPEDLCAAPADVVRFVGPSRVAAAASAALAVGPDLRDSQPATRQAVATIVFILRALRTPDEEIARLVCRSKRSVRRLAALPVDLQAVHAVRVRIALEERIQNELGVRWVYAEG